MEGVSLPRREGEALQLFLGGLQGSCRGQSGITQGVCFARADPGPPGPPRCPQQRWELSGEGSPVPPGAGTFWQPGEFWEVLHSTRKPSWDSTRL